MQVSCKNLPAESFGKLEQITTFCWQNLSGSAARFTAVSRQIVTRECNDVTEAGASRRVALRGRRLYCTRTCVHALYATQRFVSPQITHVYIYKKIYKKYKYIYIYEYIYILYIYIVFSPLVVRTHSNLLQHHCVLYDIIHSIKKKRDYVVYSLSTEGTSMPPFARTAVGGLAVYTYICTHICIYVRHGHALVRIMRQDD